MVLQEKSVTCPACRHRFRATPQLTYLGFQKFRCPKCHKRFLYPLVKRHYYGVLMAVLSLVILFALAGYVQSPWGKGLLAGAVSISLYLLERVAYLLFPLALWALLRLVGMHYSKTLPMARKVLRWTGIVAGVGILIEILGVVASLILRGVAFEPLLAALISAGLLLLVLAWDRKIRVRLR